MLKDLDSNQRAGRTAAIAAAGCPACGGAPGEIFYSVRDVPVHQVHLIRSRAEAVRMPRGDIELRICRRCGFVWNGAFEPQVMHYEDGYESTQSVSPTFNDFHARLARQVFDRFDLRGKEILEIGCGQGEFLMLLRELGAGRGTGFDPAYRGTCTDPQLTFVREIYSEAHAQLRPDFVCSKMVFEHIADPGRTLRVLRRAIGDRAEVRVFVMIPEITRILDLHAFWDVYYEHCSYFSPGSLARTFRAAGFDVEDVWLDYDRQYVLIAARPGGGRQAPLPVEETPEVLIEKARAFTTATAAAQDRWRLWLQDQRRAGRRVVLWGGGSKAVSFLTSLVIGDEIEYAIDINPRRSGTYIAGTGQRIMGPEFLREYRPDIVLVMSPIYREEIAATIRTLGLTPRLLSVEDGPGSPGAMV